MPVPSSLVERLTKGSPLTAQEGDNNWSILRDSINALEALLLTSVNADGTVKTPSLVYGTSSSGTDAYAAALTNFTPTAEADLTNRIILLKPTSVGNTTVTGPTLQITGANAVARGIKLIGGRILNANDMRPNHVSILVWDAINTWFELQNPCTVPPVNFYADSGVANAYVVASTPALPFAEPLALYVGYTVRVKIAGGNSNNATSTLKVGVLAATTIAKPTTGGTLTTLIGGELVAGRIYDFSYDGTYFQVLNPTSQFYESSPIVLATGVLLNAVSHNLGGLPDHVWGFLRCTVNDAASGYVVGDDVPLEGAAAGAGSYPPVCISATATTITAVGNAAGGLSILTKAAGTAVNATNKTNFSLIVRARRWI